MKLYVALALLSMIFACNPPVEVPTDAAPSTCTLTTAEIAAMFHTGAVTKDGIVDAPNSLGFEGDTAEPPSDCPFYEWAEQAFLWVTSPAPAIYGKDARVFESPVFYDVTPPDASGERTLVPHEAGRIHVMAVRANKTGPHHLPIVFSKAGILLEYEEPPTSPNGKLLVSDRSGRQIEVQEIKAGDAGRPIFVGKDGQTISGVRPIFRTPHPPTTILQRFMVNKTPVFFDLFGDVVQVETGQADDAVLITQGNSLVYYLVMVNDVFAYFRTGISHGQINTGSFPFDAGGMQSITTYARANSRTLADSNAMAVELKSSWVLASSLPDPQNYFTITAAVPHYNQTPTQWTLVPNVLDTVQLAMVGMHVVGNVRGHPEMVWSTFIHTGVAPDSTYSYTNPSTTVTETANTNGTWLLCANGAPPPYNQQRQGFDLSTGNIVATSGNTIGPSNIISMKPWGAAADLPPNPFAGGSANANSEVIAANNVVFNALIAGDLRKNYIFRGATWTLGGHAPTVPPAIGSSEISGDETGTTSLSNVTMETFQQGNTSIWTGTNCFTCHQNANPAVGSADTGVSHIFFAMKPLF